MSIPKWFWVYINNWACLKELSMLKPNFKKADGLGINFEYTKMILSIHKKLSMLKKFECAQTKFWGSRWTRHQYCFIRNSTQMLSNFKKNFKKLVSFWKRLQYWKNKTFSYKTIISVVKILGPGLKGCICLQRMTHCWNEYFPNLLESGLH